MYTWKDGLDTETGPILQESVQGPKLQHYI